MKFKNHKKMLKKQIYIIFLKFLTEDLKSFKKFYSRKI